MAKVAERNQRQLLELLKVEGNEKCADCRTRNPRWSAYDHGIFLCVQCAGLHRKLGTHISKVKSLTLDTWSREQVDHMKSVGNKRSNSLLNPDEMRNRPPTSIDESERDSQLEKYIRNKYESKSFMVLPTTRSPSSSPPPSSQSQTLRARSQSTSSTQSQSHLQPSASASSRLGASSPSLQVSNTTGSSTASSTHSTSTSSTHGSKTVRFRPASVPISESNAPPTLSRPGSRGEQVPTKGILRGRSGSETIKAGVNGLRASGVRSGSVGSNLGVGGSTGGGYVNGNAGIQSQGMLSSSFYSTPNLGATTNGASNANGSYVSAIGNLPSSNGGISTPFSSTNIATRDNASIWDDIEVLSQRVGALPLHTPYASQNRPAFTSANTAPLPHSTLPPPTLPRSNSFVPSSQFGLEMGQEMGSPFVHSVQEQQQYMPSLPSQQAPIYPPPLHSTNSYTNPFYQAPQAPQAFPPPHSSSSYAASTNLNQIPIVAGGGNPFYFATTQQPIRPQQTGYNAPDHTLYQQQVHQPQQQQHQSQQPSFQNQQQPNTNPFYFNNQPLPQVQSSYQANGNGSGNGQSSNYWG